MIFSLCALLLTSRLFCVQAFILICLVKRMTHIFYTAFTINAMVVSILSFPDIAA